MKYDVRNVSELENKLNIVFSDKTLLVAAITHSSYANQKKDVVYNERLEFLGDSVLQLVITEYLYRNYKDKSEGELTKVRSLIVCENSLYEIALTWNLGKYIFMSKGEELTGGRQRISIQADCVEAIIAAIYLDKGFETVKEFIINVFSLIIEKANKNQIILDYKTKLQELLQKNGEVSINYSLDKYEGPPHRRKFFVSVFVNEEVIGKGEGFSKKEAEQMAAKYALMRME
ncbi:ribonuclease III [Clostridium sp. 19966]|uniref:ribonuclease III n=1 Tax=Clostridium sp. 19966 TaxID=2768166 RepID=UPI0028DFE14E|nr:ribonuclease III [Clostridium sp. 19966]MDT8716452.1 ribonuclease III [Clostridium sp. 19966]